MERDGMIPTLQAAQTACDSGDTETITTFMRKVGRLEQESIEVHFHEGPMNFGFLMSTPRRGRVAISLGRQYDGFEKNVVVHRLTQILPFVKKIIEIGSLSCTQNFSMDDGGRADQVAFCSSEGSFLIPDCDFIDTGGWNVQRSEFEHQIAWDLRSDVPFWRGGSAGHRDGPTFLDLPRVRLCQLALRIGYDMAITDIVQAGGEEPLLLASGVVGAREPWQAHGSKKYNLDIDGNSSSWQGLFMKLLAGGVVLKVISPHGFKQWYYDRLIPWHNFVPIRSDLSDLVQAVDYLQSNQTEARRIAQEGRSLALSMTVEAEIEASAYQLTV